MHDAVILFSCLQLEILVPSLLLMALVIAGYDEPVSPLLHSYNFAVGK